MTLATPWAGRYPRVLRVFAVLAALAAAGLAWSLVAYGVWPPELLDVLAAGFLAVNVWGAVYSARQSRRLSGVSLEVHPDRLEISNVDGARALPRAEIDRFEIARSGDFWSWQTREQAVYAITRSGERIELQALRQNGWLAFDRANAAALEPYLASLR